MLLSCDVPGLLDVEVENPHCQMAQEAECAQEAEQEVQEPEERHVHQLEALEAVCVRSARLTRTLQEKELA